MHSLLSLQMFYYFLDLPDSSTFFRCVTNKFTGAALGRCSVQSVIPEAVYSRCCLRDMIIADVFLDPWRIMYALLSLHTTVASGACFGVLLALGSGSWSWLLFCLQQPKEVKHTTIPSLHPCNVIELCGRLVKELLKTWQHCKQWRN